MTGTTGRTKNKRKKKSTPRGVGNTGCARKRGKTSRGRRKWTMLITVSLLLVALIVIGVLCSESISRRIFPLKYGVEVAQAAKTYDIDRWLVYAVIKVESDFVPDAQSHAGATGLMQIMPETGEWVMWRKGEEYDSSRITEPGYNIEIGCYLLSYLLERYDGNLDFAIAAYNAGSGKVDEWLNSPEYYDGETLKIPYAETSNYVAKVKYSYEKYKKLYD